jgi:nitrite reductase/ring-hydroxylating ferredoxin subunit
MAFHRVASLSELPSGCSRAVRVGRREVALFNVDGTLYAIDNVCPHRLGPLGEGALEGCIVSCPWHGWRFDVTTGRGVSHRGLGVERFQVELRGDEVWVDAGPEGDRDPGDDGDDGDDEGWGGP